MLTCQIYLYIHRNWVLALSVQLLRDKMLCNLLFPQNVILIVTQIVF